MISRRLWCFLFLSIGIFFDLHASTMEFGGELRLRPEFRGNPDFNKDTNDANSFVGSRLRIVGTGQSSDDVSVKVVLQDTRNWGEEAGSSAGLTDTGEAVDIHEGYVQFSKFLQSQFNLRAGRQELSFGDQRLIGNFGWSNQGRAFDAFRVFLDNSYLSFDAFAAKRKENNASVAASSNLDRDLAGVYSSFKKVLPNNVIDVYFLQDREGDTSAVAPIRKVYTVGARVAAKTERFDCTVEIPWQFGDNGTVVGVSSDPVKIRAHALAAKAGYTFPGDKEIRFGLEYDFASGDENGADNKAKTFNNLYPTNHPHYGLMDNQGWRNVAAWNMSISAKPSPRHYVAFSIWNFALAEKEDGWYNAAGSASGALRSASANNSTTSVGDEFDFIFRFFQTPKIQWEVGFGHFFTGDFIESRISNQAGSDWAYLMSTVRF